MLTVDALAVEARVLAMRNLLRAELGRLPTDRELIHALATALVIADRGVSAGHLRLKPAATKPLNLDDHRPL